MVGSAPALNLSRPARRSLTLRPARSRNRQATLSIEGFDGFVTSTAAPIATGWSDPVAGWDLHPLKIARLFTAHYFANQLGNSLKKLAVNRGPSGTVHLANHRTWTSTVSVKGSTFSLVSKLRVFPASTFTFMATGENIGKEKQMS